MANAPPSYYQAMQDKIFFGDHPCVSTRASLNKERPRVIVIAGPPGCGKDTQCALLQEANDLYVPLSTGNLFRDAIRADSALGAEVRNYVENDAFVPDELVTQIVFDFIEKTNKQNKIAVLNGFPRTPQQSYELHMFAKVLAFVLIDVDFVTCAKRLTKRRVDPMTNKVYTEKKLEDPAIENRLIRRSHDSDHSFARQRFIVFDRLLAPILNYFGDVVRAVDGTRGRNIVAGNILQMVENSVLETSVVQSSFCTCMLRVANQINMPCGHRIWCEVCVQQFVLGEVVCYDCREPVMRFLNLARNDTCDECKIVDGMETNIQMSCNVCSVMKTKEKGVSKKCEDQEEDEEEEEITQHGMVSIRIALPDTTYRLPMNIVAVIDTSGSMNANACFEEHGEMKNAGYSLLDSVKMSLRAILGCLTPRDRFGLVVFNNNASMLRPMNFVNAEEKKMVEIIIRNMNASWCTNMWAGLKMGYDMLDQFRNSHNECGALMFLTDGSPTISVDIQDPLPLLKDYIAQRRRENQPIIESHFFGFGSNLQPKLLLEFSELANGTYSFLPDCSTVPAAFMRAMANIGTIGFQNTYLRVETFDETSFLKPLAAVARGVPPAHITYDSPRVRIIDVGSLRYGQTKNIVVGLELPFVHKKSLQATLIHMPTKKELRTAILDNLDSVSVDAQIAMARTEFVAQTRCAVMDAKCSKAAIDLLSNKLEKWTPFHPFIRMLLEETNGRVRKGVTEKYDTWGQHYVAALMRSHACQLRTNGMDPSLLMYGGKLSDAFESLGRSIYKDIRYEAAPQAPPKPDISILAKPLVIHHATNDRYSFGGGGGGCFGGNSLVYVQTPTGKFLKKVCDIVAGDYVQTVSGFDRVVVKISMSGRRVMTNIGDLAITPTHPIRKQGTTNWQQPSQFSLNTSITNVVFNFILESKPSILVNDNLECIVWGHNANDEPIKHHFYGNRERLMQLLQPLPKDKHNTVLVSCFLRDEHNHVCGFF